MKKTARKRKRSQRPSKKRGLQPAPQSAEANPHFRPRHTSVKFNPAAFQTGAFQTNAFQTGHIEPLTIFPTIYPQDPTSGGPVIVQNYITINLSSVDFRQFDAKLDELIEALHHSNEIAGEARGQIIAEMKAGRALLEAPKPDRNLIELFLKRPLLFLAKAAANSVIGKIASEALVLLGKLTGLW